MLMIGQYLACIDRIHTLQWLLPIMFLVGTLVGGIVVAKWRKKHDQTNY